MGNQSDDVGDSQRGVVLKCSSTSLGVGWSAHSEKLTK